MKGVSQAPDVGNIMQQVFCLEQKLSDFEQKLPPNLKFVDRNLYNHVSTSERITFIMIQSWWYECHCNLYRFSLPGFRESRDLSSQTEGFARHCQHQLAHYAIAQSTFWHTVAQMDQILVSDPHVVVLVYSNTKVLLAAGKYSGFMMNERRDQCRDLDEIPTLLASNVSFMDNLAKKLPWVAAAVSQRPASRPFGEPTLTLTARCNQEHHFEKWLSCIFRGDPAGRTSFEASVFA